MGVGAVAGHLLAEEVEHYRCGIGMVLESGPHGEVLVGGLVKGGTGFQSDLEQGDELLSINNNVVNRGCKIDEVAALIRGKEGSVVTIVCRKRSGFLATVRLVRQRLPGGKTEMLGALWQSPNNKGLNKEPVTISQRLDVLAQLRSRGNLSAEEYDMAKRRLTGSGGAVFHTGEGHGGGSGSFYSTGSDHSLPPDRPQHWYDGEAKITRSESMGNPTTSTPIAGPQGVRSFSSWDFNSGDQPPSPPHAAWHSVKRNLAYEVNTTFTM